LNEVRPYVTDAPPGLGDDLAGPPQLPRGAHVETMSQWLERDPDGSRAALDGGSGLPNGDKLAQLARGFWSHGRHVEIPAGVAGDEAIGPSLPLAAPRRARLSPC